MVLSRHRLSLPGTGKIWRRSSQPHLLVMCLFSNQTTAQPTQHRCLSVRCAFDQTLITAHLARSPALSQARHEAANPRQRSQSGPQACVILPNPQQQINWRHTASRPCHLAHPPTRLARLTFTCYSHRLASPDTRPALHWSQNHPATPRNRRPGTNLGPYAWVSTATHTRPATFALLSILSIIPPRRTPPQPAKHLFNLKIPKLQPPARTLPVIQQGQSCPLLPLPCRPLRGRPSPGSRAFALCRGTSTLLRYPRNLSKMTST